VVGEAVVMMGEKVIEPCGHNVTAHSLSILV